MSDEFTIKTAERKESPVSAFIQGVSGSGKTYSSLLLARGLAGPEEKIGIIDTEGGRSLIYADDPDIGGFEHMPFEAPFSPDRFIRASNAAIKAGWKAIVIDSLSLEHDGEGGLLEMADEEEQKILAKNPHNRASSQQKWTQPKLAHKRMLNHFCGLPVHVIGCFRETLTTDFDAKDENGRKKPTTVLSVVAEKNTLFSFELHATIDKDHRAHWSRIPKPYIPAIRNGEPITVKMGRDLASSSGVGGKAVSTHGPETGQPESGGNDDETRTIALQDISTFLESESIDPASFNAAIESAYKGKFRDYEKLPTEHLEKLSKQSALAKMAALAERIENGEA